MLETPALKGKGLNFNPVARLTQTEGAGSTPKPRPDKFYQCSSRSKQEGPVCPEGCLTHTGPPRSLHKEQGRGERSAMYSYHVGVPDPTSQSYTSTEYVEQTQGPGMIEGIRRRLLPRPWPWRASFILASIVTEEANTAGRGIRAERRASPSQWTLTIWTGPT